MRNDYQTPTVEAAVEIDGAHDGLSHAFADPVAYLTELGLDVELVEVLDTSMAPAA